MSRHDATRAVSLADRRINLAAAIAAADDEQAWRVDRLAADGFVTVLAGRGGEGKSIVMQALAAGIQLGTTIAGLNCAAGRVTIFDAENGAPLIGRRLKTAGTPIDRLEIYDAAGLDLDRDRAPIEATIRDDRANLVVFDSLRTLAPRARENDSDDMAPIMSALRQIARDTSAAVVLLHHRDKALEHDFRGSGAIHDQADLVFVLDRDKADPEQRWRRRLRCAKCRIDAEPPDRWIGIRHGRDGLHLTDADAYQPTERRADARDELADQALHALRSAGPLTLADLARQLDRSPKDGTLRRALDRLQRNGNAQRTDAGWTVPPADAAPPAPDTGQIPLPTSDNGVPPGDVAPVAPPTPANGATAPTPRRGGAQWHPGTPDEEKRP